MTLPTGVYCARLHRPVFGNSRLVLRKCHQHVARLKLYHVTDNVTNACPLSSVVSWVFLSRDVIIVFTSTSLGASSSGACHRQPIHECHRVRHTLSTETLGDHSLTTGWAVSLGCRNQIRKSVRYVCYE